MADAPLGGLARLMAMKGRKGDNMLAHINPMEAKLLRMYGGSGTINPSTGLPEFSMAGDKDYTVQGGYKNYADDTGEVKTIEVPENWKSGPAQPTTHPAFITEKEQSLLKKANLHKKEDPSEIGKGKGPGGLASFDGAGSGEGFSEGEAPAAAAAAAAGTSTASQQPATSNTTSTAPGEAAEAASEAAQASETGFSSFGDAPGMGPGVTPSVQSTPDFLAQIDKALQSVRGKGKGRGLPDIGLIEHVEPHPVQKPASEGIFAASDGSHGGGMNTDGSLAEGFGEGFEGEDFGLATGSSYDSTDDASITAYSQTGLESFFSSVFGRFSTPLGESNPRGQTSFTANPIGIVSGLVSFLAAPAVVAALGLKGLMANTVVGKGISTAIGSALSDDASEDVDIGLIPGTDETDTPGVAAGFFNSLDDAKNTVANLGEQIGKETGLAAFMDQSKAAMSNPTPSTSYDNDDDNGDGIDYKPTPTVMPQVAGFEFAPYTPKPITSRFNGLTQEQILAANVGSDSTSQYVQDDDSTSDLYIGDGGDRYIGGDGGSYIGSGGDSYIGSGGDRYIGGDGGRYIGSGGDSYIGSGGSPYIGFSDSSRYINPIRAEVGGGLEKLYEQQGGDYGEFSGVVKGGVGDGMSDDVAFRVQGGGPVGPDMALLSNDEYVVDANTMSLLGNGSPDAGANILDKWREGVREEATGSIKQAKQLDPNKQLSGLASLGKIDA
tara:strand:- start:26483 stop:28642 length:2160 start_codon:yes stop_codon:yes gene_type:complete